MYVQKTGDTMTGPLVLSADPASPLQAADKHYVDANIAALGGGSATKVSTLPSVTQTVAQPSGTQLEVNLLNGTMDATGFLTGNGGNGIGNALASGNCPSGCELSVSQTYPGSDAVPLGGLPSGTHVVDHRGGADVEVQENPLPASGAAIVSKTIRQVTTRSAQQAFATRPSTGADNQMLLLTHSALTGGSNQFPVDVETVPYNKNNYGILQMSGNYNTQGQHVQFGNVVNCYAVGDCLAGGQFITSSGGYRDEADEGAHPFDLQLTEDNQVFQGTCATGCATGATSLVVTPTLHGGTQGDGRFLMDKNPSKVLTSGMVAGTGNDLLPVVTFTGTSFPVSTQLVTAAAAISQANNLSPGTVTLPIATSGLSQAYATNTAALPAASGVACVTDQGAFPNFETAIYQVVDGTHLQLTLNKVHRSAAVVAVGGLCGYGLEVVADTVGQVRQVFPIAGSPSATQVYYAAALTPVAGASGGSSTGGFLNVSVAIASASRSGNVVTLNLTQRLPYDMNGLSMKVSGMGDASYNGTFAVTTTGVAALTYVANGSDGSSTGGTVSFLNGSFAIYPMAEVLSVYNPAADSVDGTFSLAPNTVAWSAGDAVEEPHYYQQLTYADTEFVTQYVPRPVQYAFAGKLYQGQMGPGAKGWAIANAVPASNYVGAGGTHQVPDAAYVASGPWRNAMEVDAGTEAVVRVHCNLNSCTRWDSGYALFAMDRNGGVEDFLNYSPQNSTASWQLGGTTYSFSPSAFVAGNVQATNVTAASLHTGFNGNAQIASGGSSGYSNFTLNGNNNDGSRLGFIGGGSGDPNLYLDVPTGGQFNFRFGSTATSVADGTANGLTAPALTTPGGGYGQRRQYRSGGDAGVAGRKYKLGDVQLCQERMGLAPVCVVQPQSVPPNGGQRD